MQQQSKTFKVTRAGRQYLAFIARFNTGDPEQMRAFVRTNFDPFSFSEEFEEQFLAWYRQAYAQTGGMRILRNYLTEEFYVIILAEGLQDGKTYLDKITVTAEAPHLITEYFHETKRA